MLGPARWRGAVATRDRATPSSWPAPGRAARAPGPRLAPRPATQARPPGTCAAARATRPRPRPRPRRLGTSPPTSSARPPTRSKPPAPPRRQKMPKRRAAANACGSALNCRKRFASSCSTTSDCATTSAGSSSTAERLGYTPMAVEARSPLGSIVHFYKVTHDRLLKASEELTPAQFVWSAGPSLHSVAWQLWHSARWDDFFAAHVQADFEREPSTEVWAREGLAEEWGFAT